MDNQPLFYPKGLSKTQFIQLEICARRAEFSTKEQLRSLADSHLRNIVQAHQTNRLINLQLAQAIHQTIQVVLDTWEAKAEFHRWWLGGAIFYFAEVADDEPDFDSPLGFEDDTEVLNACLKFAHCENLCLNPEDYDDV